MMKRVMILVFMASLALSYGVASAQENDASGCGNSLVVQALAGLKVDMECSVPIVIDPTMIPPGLTMTGTVTKLVIHNKDGGEFDVAEMIAQATGARKGSPVKVKAVLKSKWESMVLKSVVLDINLFANGTRDAKITITESGENVMKEIMGSVSGAIKKFLNGK
jgi:hypothetical protein